MLQDLVKSTDGFYHQAIRGSSGEALRALSDDIATRLNLPAPLALTSWSQAMETLLRLAEQRPMTIVLDEFPYLLEHTPGLDSIIQSLFGPQHPLRLNTRARLILCGSSISIMSKLLAGTAPLRGRAGLSLRVTPFDFRTSRELHRVNDLSTAISTFAVIGGVAAYAREMVDDDLPLSSEDFDRWVCERVLAPGRPLLGEIDLLLSEDPATAKSRKINLYHSTLAAVAQGCHTWGTITNYVKTGGSSLQAIMDTLIASDLVTRKLDPVRTNRTLYQPVDPFLRFHYAIIRKNPILARLTTDTAALWARLTPTFRSLVLGPCFEWMAREWTMHMAAHTTIGGAPEHVGSTVLNQGAEAEHEIDIVVAADDEGAPPEKRTVRALGEAKIGQTMTMQHLHRLEMDRATFGPRAANARLLLFGSSFDAALIMEAERRADVEIIDLERLYSGQ